MCGIVGLFLKNKALEPKLGSMLSQMLGTMCERGPDSAGFAIYGSGAANTIKLTLRGPEETNFQALAKKLERVANGPVSITPRTTHAVLSIPAAAESDVRDELNRIAPEIAIVGIGTSMELYKEVGMPTDVAKRFALESMSGTHGIGHTRMATESAVTTAGAHPFSTGTDQCLVHNGSLSNHNNLRRDLKRDGMKFETENDSEVAAAYLTWRMKQGLNLGQALVQLSQPGLNQLLPFEGGLVFGVFPEIPHCHGSRDRQHAVEAVGQQVGDRAGRHQHRFWKPWSSQPAETNPCRDSLGCGQEPALGVSRG